MYYKCCDVAQMLIVYEDSMALDEADSYPKVEGFPSYYHSGLTPPLKRVVETRFASREHKALPPPRAQIMDVEQILLELIENITKGTSGNNHNNNNSAANKRKPVAAQHATKILEEIQDEIVEYEPWMDAHGQEPEGIEFTTDDPQASLHPEVWIQPNVIKNMLKEEEQQRQQDMSKKKAKQAAPSSSSVKKEGKKKKNKQQQQQQQQQASHKKTESSEPPTRKGIASKKNMEHVDEVTQAAASMLSADNLLDVVLEDDDLFGFEGMNFEDLEQDSEL
jgi:transcription initiation factor TFIID subunit 7